MITTLPKMNRMKKHHIPYRTNSNSGGKENGEKLKIKVENIQWNHR